MDKPTNLIDVSVWTGEWPFLKLRFTRPDELEGKLTSVGVRRAYIASLRGIFEQDPYRSNRELLESGLSDFFFPVPIVDLSCPNWPESIEAALADKRVELIKLLPSYHRYELDAPVLEKLVEAVDGSDIVIGIQIRFEDQRGSYPNLTVPDLEVNKMVHAVSAFPDQPFILHNVYRRELNDTFSYGDNIYVDLASIEMHNTLQDIQSRLGSGTSKVLFSTHAPFYYPEGNINKIRFSDIGREETEGIAFRNAERLFRGAAKAAGNM